MFWRRLRRLAAEEFLDRPVITVSFFTRELLNFYFFYFRGYYLKDQLLWYFTVVSSLNFLLILILFFVLKLLRSPV